MSSKIISIMPGSPASKTNIQVGDTLLLINGHRINDVLDYKFYGYDENCCIRLQNSHNQEYEVSVKKEAGRDLGLEFETYLMDKPRRCSNNCIFCFIDQMPSGMRPTLYFKDDDSRLSFLLGNYVTMTNLSEDDIQRIIDMRISPLRVSVHATEPEVRKKMLGNRHAGSCFEKLQKFNDAGIKIQAQIVLCPGINDGKHLDHSLQDLLSLCPNLTSVSIVPVGLTKYREGLFPLQPVTSEEARTVIHQVEEIAEICYRKYGHRTFYCSDEFYLKANLPFHDSEYYEGFEQLENGIGMIPLFKDEFFSALSFPDDPAEKEFTLSIATGLASYEMIREAAASIESKWPNLHILVYPIQNDFFGPMITVSGLIVGMDMIHQLQNKELGSVLLIPENVLRHGETVFLDDVTIDQLSESLNVPVLSVPNDGGIFLDTIIDATYHY